MLDYFHDLLESHSWNTVKLDLYGLQFFYTHVLQKTWEHIPLIKKPKARRIPDILSIKQVNQLIDATRDGIPVAMKKVVDHLWPNKKISCHSLRYSYATHLLNDGVDLIELKSILGHVSLLTTARYTHLTSVNHENACKKINTIIDSFAFSWGGEK